MVGFLYMLPDTGCLLTYIPLLSRHDESLATNDGMYRPLAAGCTCMKDGSNLKGKPISKLAYLATGLSLTEYWWHSLLLKSKPQPRSALSLAFNTILSCPRCGVTPSFHYRGRLHMPYAC
jgi:hypothetical protein